ncbi:hypothetical protein TNCV_3065041 [Trichonephila clavipes]|nr:hypothetical protein TNCV_3065041 [Trichonephila clavipes]
MHKLQQDGTHGKIGANVRNSPRKTQKGETTRNRNTSTEFNKTSKKVTPTLSFAAALTGTAKQNSTPGTPAANEETPSLKENNNDNDFGFKDAIRELRRFFLDYPFS